ncbi:MAG: metallophosphoesterase [Kiritimatiellae bacterium]|nr:metallophosphoesterase [Kiritimatiellia bacterium]
MERLFSQGFHGTRRGFIFGAGAFGLMSCFPAENSKADFDDSLTVLMSDIHIACGAITTKRGVQTTHQNALFKKTVDRVLLMRPLPRRVVVLGDVSLWFGYSKDYEIAKSEISRLKAKGIEVYLATGNHDHRVPMGNMFPECISRSPVKGRFVSVVDLGTSDLFLLDSLKENPAGEGSRNANEGELCDAQGEWLLSAAKSAKRPFFVASHHPVKGLLCKGAPLVSVLGKMPLFAGYLHGHNHRWNIDWQGMKDGGRVFWSACIPSTGCWGDIGYALLRTENDRAVLTNVQEDFFYPLPLAEGRVRPAEWNDIAASKNGARCIFRYPAATR